MWTQSVTRHRWLLVKLAVVGGIALVAAAIYSGVATWFAEPFNAVNFTRMANGLFDLEGIVPISYTIFAFAVGVAAGTVLRRVVTAMGATLVTFIACRGVVAGAVRSHLLPTRSRTYDALRGFGRPAGNGDWVVSGHVLTRTGEVFSSTRDINLTPARLQRWCPDVMPRPGVFVEKALLDDCVGGLGLRVTEIYHPASQFWTLQLVEASLFLGASVALLGFTVWWALRRVV